MSFYKIMAKNFEISDILDAVKNISTIEKKAGIKGEIKSDSTDNSNCLPSNNQVKFNKSDILVLDQMIE
tara:strand:- start:278 stop:484 length:207 start_codon:yes stop_codon:yes gene_type:complete